MSVNFKGIQSHGVTGFSFDAVTLITTFKSFLLSNLKILVLYSYNSTVKSSKLC